MEWRNAHRATTRFWHRLENGLKRALRRRERVALGNLVFEMIDGNLFLTLPSGRRLAYPEPRIEPGKYPDTTQLVFKDNAKGGWRDVRGWHGIFVENVVAGISRDLLAAAMLRVEAAGYPIVLHVHDEVGVRGCRRLRQRRRICRPDVGIAGVGGRTADRRQGLAPATLCQADHTEDGAGVAGRDARGHHCGRGTLAGTAAAGAGDFARRRHRRAADRRQNSLPLSRRIRRHPVTSIPTGTSIVTAVRRAATSSIGCAISKVSTKRPRRPCLPIGRPGP